VVRKLIIRGLVICAIVVCISIYYILASSGKINGADEKIKRIANSIKVGDEEEREEYVKLMWKIGGYIGLIVGVLGIIVTLVMKGKVLEF
jgi:preprotein translocase subunit Sss1